MTTNGETHSSGLLYFIPYWIFESEKLSSSAKLAYALLTGLAHGNEKKECYPSDEYIASRLKLKRRASANQLIKELEDFGAIEKRVESHPKNRFKRLRIITVLLELKKCLRVTENRNLDMPENRNSRVTENRTQVNKGNRNKESSLKGAKEGARKLRAPHVFVSDSEDQKLIDDFGKEMVERAYTKLSEWKSDTPKSKWKKNDHLAIRRWVIDALKEQDIKAEKASKTPSERIKKVQEHIQSHPKRNVLREALKRNLIDLSKEYLTILGGQQPQSVNFQDIGACEQIDKLIYRLEETMYPINMIKIH